MKKNKDMDRRKLNIAVLFGGCSPEYGVSLASAYSVIRSMDKERYQPLLIGISQRGEWFFFDGDVKKIEEDTWCNGIDCKPAAISPNPSKQELLIFHSDKTRTILVDGVFPILHGKNGEDGTVQGLIELSGIPLVGCGALASALCMDKERAHRLAQAAGVAVPKGVTLNEEEVSDIMGRTSELQYPLFVKPVKAGSSYGITKVQHVGGLQAAVNFAFQYDDQVMIEEAIDGFEVGCAIMGNKELLTGEIDEIELSGGFFDFTEKYTLKSSFIHVPARISKERSEEIKKTAKVIYKALGCRGFARVDMFLQPNGAIVFNEVNTIPGFTNHSRFPGMMRARGISYEQMISKMIEGAVGE